MKYSKVQQPHKVSVPGLNHGGRVEYIYKYALNLAKYYMTNVFSYEFSLFLFSSSHTFFIDLILLTPFGAAIYGDNVNDSIKILRASSKSSTSIRFSCIVVSPKKKLEASFL